MRQTILFFVGDGPFFASHRLNLVSGAVAAGYHVAVACPADSAAIQRIRAVGGEWIEWKIDRGGTSVVREILSFFRTIAIIRRVQPALIHAIAIKCILHAGIATKFLRTPFVGAVSGLGYVYAGRNGVPKTLLRDLVNRLLNFGLNRRDVHFIFQNADDEQMVEFAHLDRVSVHRIGGSGVDLTKITMHPHPQQAETRVGLPARLLRSKGVVEFVEAARELRRRGRNAAFLLIGDPDPINPTSVTFAEINAWVAQGQVQWIAHTKDIGSILATLHVVALPSYREGFPKTLIDAAAAGRAAVTSDVPGCRDAVVQDVTGVLCQAQDAVALADAIDRLILDRDLCVRMGIAARTHAEKHFNVDDVTCRHLDIYRKCINVDVCAI